MGLFILGIISGGGDVFAQLVLEKGKKPYDPWRTARFFSLATLFIVSSIDLCWLKIELNSSKGTILSLIIMF